MVDDLDYDRGYRQLAVRGGMGTGKSHLLAAMAFALHREGKQVIYIPDCQAFAVKPITVLYNAFTLAFYHPKEKYTPEICELSVLEDVKGFVEFARNWAAKKRMYFIVDQMNALDEDPYGKMADRKIREKLRGLLLEMAGDHYLIQSSSGNYYLGLEDSRRLTSWKYMDLNRGFSKVSHTTGRIEDRLLT